MGSPSAENVGVTFDISGVSSISKVTDETKKNPNVAGVSLGGKSLVNFSNVDITPKLKNVTWTASTTKSVI